MFRATFDNYKVCTGIEAGTEIFLPQKVAIIETS